MSMTAHQPNLRTAWLVVALLFPVALLNYLDRQMLAAMQSSVMGDITDIKNKENWGYMLGQFKWVYAILSPFGGYIADRISKRFVIVLSVAAWSMVTFATGQVTTYQELLWTRTLMGISEAFYIPAALALITDYHTKRTRSRAVGIHQVAIYFGVILGGFTGYAADDPNIGWRAIFQYIGLFGIVYAIPLGLILRDYSMPHSEQLPPVGPHQASSSIFHDLLLNRSYVFLILYFTLPALPGWVIRDWMPVILKDRFSLGQGLAGVSATLYVSLASFAGAIFGGWAADRWMKTQSRGRIYVSAIGMSLLIPALFGVGNAHTLFLAIVFLALFGLGWGVFDANNMPILSQIVSPKNRATGYGLMNFVSISCGGFADWGFGTLQDSGVRLNLIFAAFAGLAAISIGLVLMIRPKPQYSDTI